MDDQDWERLLTRIRTGRCTPFLGAGASAGRMPLGSELAERWAAEHGYPLEDRHDLSRVAQFIGVDSGDPMWPKEKMAAEWESFSSPGSQDGQDPYAMLAELPLPVYMTTNYDDLMTQALRSRGRDPRREICRWNRSPAVASEPSVFAADPAFVPTVETPLVFHLHGRIGLPESLVLTEDDYLDFLVAISRDDRLLPHQIHKALAGSSLLFIGYRLADWDFRVLHRGIVMAGEQSLRRLSVTVQLRPGGAAERYLASYFAAMNVRVFWGTAADFASELWDRWRASAD